jgi:hypothetical protein
MDGQVCAMGTDVVAAADEGARTAPPAVALSGSVLAVVRATALFNGRDPELYTQTDFDQALHFINMFNAALWEVRHSAPCSHCGGSGVEPRRHPVKIG